MTDEELRSENLERGLKQAVAEASARDTRLKGSTYMEGERATIAARKDYGPSAIHPAYNGNTRKAAMTGPEVINAIENLEKRADEIQALARDLADTLAGPDLMNVSRAQEPEPPTSIFDRMGVELMLLTRTLTAIEADVRRALGAVKP